MNSASRQNHLTSALLAALMIFTGSAKSATVFTSAVSSGNWSNSTTWTNSGSGGSPVSYVIQPGHTITMDVDVNNIDTLIIHGTLTMGNNKELMMKTSGFISFSGTGVLQQGSSNTEIRFGTSSSVFIQGPFTAGNLISGGPRFGTLSTMIAANGDPQGSFPVALPLVVKAVAVENSGSDFKLTWTVLGEANKNTFSIDISANGRDFVQVGTIQGNPDLTEGNYSFYLGEVSDQLFVKLSMLTSNGIEALLVKQISNPVHESARLQVFPTLLESANTPVNLVLPEAGNFKISLYNAAMQNLGSAEVVSQTAGEKQSIRFTDLKATAGIYFLTISQDGHPGHTEKVFIR